MKFFTIYDTTTGEIVGRAASSTGDLPQLRPGQDAVVGFYQAEMFKIVDRRPVPKCAEPVLE
jgi:hypothetical protein